MNDTPKSCRAGQPTEHVGRSYTPTVITSSAVEDGKTDAWHSPCRLGIDVGSTTVKAIILSPEGDRLFGDYRRHRMDTRGTARDILQSALATVGDVPVLVRVTGSGGIGVASDMGCEFVQEVVCSRRFLTETHPETDAAIELGGEDAKIIYLKPSVEERMNGTCAGGTGAFIDQMASLLDTDAAGLNELAMGATHLYPIASRCGVFAKSDVQPLINEGADRRDIARSILRAVVDQTIGGLACGHPIRGHVALLGGPLSYLPALRREFADALPDGTEFIVPEDGQLAVATGCAMAGTGTKAVALSDVASRLASAASKAPVASGRLRPLFADEGERREFDERHGRETVPRKGIGDARGLVYLGVDAGSTTLKACLVDSGGSVLWTWYSGNDGNVLGAARRMFRDLHDALPGGATVARATSTGYGEQLLIDALGVDGGEIETVCHLKGAQAFDPAADFVLDIGGQDMKCLRVKDGVIDSIQLNEACSSGCGSFLETFAKTMGMDAPSFARLAEQSQAPVDLGSRCTVFMNSRVKEAQREGATAADIAAGLSYSIIKNALFKVIKLRSAEDVGRHPVVQGGTFLSDATLRAFELLSGANAVRPDLAGCMGAYGAALISLRDAKAAGQERSSLIPMKEMESLIFKRTHARCGRCANNCRLTVTRFSNGRVAITGNRCERGAGRGRDKATAPNLFERKRRLVWDRECLKPEEAVRGTVGMPRVLNMWEDYPFWHRFFTELGYAVIPSGESTPKTYARGMESIPSESVCYPAKIAHGHVIDLLGKGVDVIWYPCIQYERLEDATATNHYNCPVVMSYPQVIGLNMDELQDSGTRYLYPFVPYDDGGMLCARMYDILNEDADERGMPRVTHREVRVAVRAAFDADREYKVSIAKMGDDALRWMEEHHAHGIVLAGRPYHDDREIDHGIPEMIAGYGFAVLTEDSVAHFGPPDRPMRVVDQWMYHSRLYRAAKFVGTREDLDLVQLISFGCGLDALTADEVQEILAAYGKTYTSLKIDEVSNLGAARIRIRSLIAALRERGDIDGVAAPGRSDGHDGEDGDSHAAGGHPDEGGRDGR